MHQQLINILWSRLHAKTLVSPIIQVTYLKNFPRVFVERIGKAFILFAKNKSRCGG